MFDFAEWWDERCFESWALVWDAGQGVPVRDQISHRLLFVPKPSPVYLKDSERQYPPWAPSNDWKFNGWGKGEKDRYSADFNTIDFDDFLNHKGNKSNPEAGSLPGSPAGATPVGGLGAKQ
jgi:hypothetical protein